MTNDKYAKAYTEVLEILKYLPKNEYDKIAKEKIKFFEINKDNSYKYSINPHMPLDKQNISIETNSIIIVLFRDYFATEKQKEKLNTILKQNEDKYELEIRNKYKPDAIFKKRSSNIIENNTNEGIKDNNLLIEVKEENFFKKFIAYIKNLILKK